MTYDKFGSGSVGSARMRKRRNFSIATFKSGERFSDAQCSPSLALTTEVVAGAGILSTAKADDDRSLAAGFTIVAVGSDLGLLARGSDARIASFRS